MREARIAVSPDPRDGAFREGRWSRAPTAALVRERLEKDRNDADALFVLAAMRTRDGDVDEGLTILDRVLVIDPSYPGAWLFKAKLHRMRGEQDAAESARARAEASEP